MIVVMMILYCRSKSSIPGESTKVPPEATARDTKPLYPEKRGLVSEKKPSRESLYPEKRGLVSDKKAQYPEKRGLVTSPYKSHT